VRDHEQEPEEDGQAGAAEIVAHHQPDGMIGDGGPGHGASLLVGMSA
jgi:hypothetical protein